MLQLTNDSPFTATMAPFPDERGIDTLYVVHKATFSLMPVLAVAETQVPVFNSDEHWGKPGESSLKYASEIHVGKPSTDVLLVGRAWAPGGRAVSESAVMVSVAGRQKVVRVFGDRVWRRGRGFTAPEPFESLPLMFERAFGGRHETAPGEAPAADARNPVGVGFLGRRSPADLVGQKLPNLEHPTLLIERLGDAPPPASFGCVAPSWLPRITHAGTYDRQWQRKRAPFLPLDFNARFLNCASEELICDRHLVGGEPVQVLGAHRGGPLRFQLPTCRWDVSAVIAGTKEPGAPRLETVLIEPDDNRLCLTWRTAIACDRKLLQLERVSVRLLELDLPLPGSRPA